MNKENNIAYAIHAGAAMLSISIILSSNLGAIYMGIATTLITVSFIINARFHS